MKRPPESPIAAFLKRQLARRPYRGVIKDFADAIGMNDRQINLVLNWGKSFPTKYVPKAIRFLGISEDDAEYKQMLEAIAKTAGGQVKDTKGRYSALHLRLDQLDAENTELRAKLSLSDQRLLTAEAQLHALRQKLIELQSKGVSLRNAPEVKPQG